MVAFTSPAPFLRNQKRLVLAMTPANEVKLFREAIIILIKKEIEQLSR